MSERKITFNADEFQLLLRLNDAIKNLEEKSEDEKIKLIKLLVKIIKNFEPLIDDYCKGH
jgi:hypothetical protein